MLEKPDLQNEKIIACLRNHYALPAAGLEFLPLGNDATAWVYRVNTGDGRAYFLKVKKGRVCEPSVNVPHVLKAQGIEQVVAPLPTAAQALWVDLDTFALILYSFIEGPTGMDAGMSDAQWREFGAVLKQIHATRLPADVLEQVQRETFVPKWSGMVRVLEARIRDGKWGDLFEQELAAFWGSRRDEIAALVERTEMLGRILQQRSGDFVLCHSDIHTANILIDQQGGLHIVDWDQPLLAPIERDLMFVAGRPVPTTREELNFFNGYGHTTIDPVALAYYRYEWVVQEIGDYGERVFWGQDVGVETRQDSVRGFRQLFLPGDVVEAAYRSEADLPAGLRVC